MYINREQVIADLKPLSKEELEQKMMDSMGKLMVMQMRGDKMSSTVAFEAAEALAILAGISALEA